MLGFNLHASPATEAHDRQGLERILRYMGRPPFIFTSTATCARWQEFDFAIKNAVAGWNIEYFAFAF